MEQFETSAALSFLQSIIWVRTRNNCDSRLKSIICLTNLYIFCFCGLLFVALLRLCGRHHQFEDIQADVMRAETLAGLVCLRVKSLGLLVAFCWFNLLLWRR